MTQQNRKPRIALMGEFSAGKSTLSNLLLGARPLPEKVTATRLSPVWMSAGNAEPYRIDVNGEETPISLTDLGNIPVDETRAIRLFFESEILDVCDLIDFPGISDPNMSSDVWQRMLDEVDAVIWCTHATQAWRQSEASVWDIIPDAVRSRSILLITRFDKLTTERDRMRVQARLAKETKGLFGAMFPISLTNALAAGDDYDAFKASGAIDFVEHLLATVEQLSVELAETRETLFAANQAVSAAPTAPDTQPEEEYSAPVIAEIPETSVAASAPVAATPGGGHGVVVPRRVRPRHGATRRPRPRNRSEAIDMSAIYAAGAAPAASVGSTATSELRAIFQEAPILADE